MSRPLQEIEVFALQDRRRHGKPKPWIVRWRLDGRQRARAFRLRADADRYRSVLAYAALKGEPFDPESGEPVSWSGSTDDPTLYEWVRRWLAEQWEEWQPRTRTSAVEAMVRFVPLVAATEAPPPPPSMRAHLIATLRPDGGADAEQGHDREAAEWLLAYSMRLSELTREGLARTEAALGVGCGGQALAASTAARFRKLARGCIRRAVELEVLSTDPWPPSSRGRAARKAVRVRRSVDVRALPDPSAMREILAAMSTNQPASLTYRLMTAVVYYAGLRPSEVVTLRPRCLSLPTDENTWGRIEVVEADIGDGTPGEPKTGARSVPIPPVLVIELRKWLAEHPCEPDEFIFRTRTGRRPASSNWNRAWHKALGRLGHSGWRIYDCRHAAATTWLASGAPLGEVARRLGHSVDTLVSTYVGALVGDEAVTNSRIAAAIGGAVPLESSKPPG